jgi:phage terminase large subunit GpA-like protein
MSRNSAIAAIRRNALRALIPPPRLLLSQWIEANIVLPAGISAMPGKVRLFPYQRSIADSISDPSVERITLVKPVRIGFSSLLTAAIGSFVANDPSPILLLLPTESDARDVMVTEIEPVFQATPALRGLLRNDAEDAEHNTLLSKRFPGGSLKVVAARAPRNLRRHTARILLCDEVDAMEASSEGAVLRLAERRTLSFSNRKIVVGSTPLFLEGSPVLRAYAASDQRIFEAPCPECGAFNEILWHQIEWEPDRPETAAYRCPNCKILIHERYKAAMVAAGEWRVTRPEVVGHHGYRINALVSVLANASWAKLAEEFIAVKDDPAELQTFVNTILAEGWQESGEQIDDEALIRRAEPFDLNHIPPECLAITCGCDVQDDRVEVSICGWTRQHECLVLGHSVIFGAFTDADTWKELDDLLLRSKWQHSGGGLLRVDAAVVDAGDGDHFDTVVNFCTPRLRRRIFAGKGMSGARPGFAFTKDKRHGNRLALIGVDTLKTAIYDRLQRGATIRFSDSLEPVYFEQLASERRVIRYVKGRPLRRFERIGRKAAESLDCLVYSYAARQALSINFDQREDQLNQISPPVPPPNVDDENPPESGPAARPPQHRDRDPNEYHSAFLESRQPQRAGWIHGGRPRRSWWDRGEW